MYMIKSNVCVCVAHAHMRMHAGIEGVLDPIAS